MTLRLFGSLTSPYVRHCRIALAQSGLPWSLELTDQVRSGALSPTKRVPFLQDGELTLTDSAVILQYIRQKSGTRFLDSIAEAQQFHLANAVGDSAINLMFLEKDGVTPAVGAYLQRQADRVSSGLAALNASDLAFSDAPDDGELRVAVVLAWGLFRNRFSLEGYGNLQRFMATMEAFAPFAETTPPRD